MFYSCRSIQEYLILFVSSYLNFLLETLPRHSPHSSSRFLRDKSKKTSIIDALVHNAKDAKVRTKEKHTTGLALASIFNPMSLYTNLWWPWPKWRLESRVNLVKFTEFVLFYTTILVLACSRGQIFYASCRDFLFRSLDVFKVPSWCCSHAQRAELARLEGRRTKCGGHRLMAWSRNDSQCLMFVFTFFGFFGPVDATRRHHEWAREASLFGGWNVCYIYHTFIHLSWIVVLHSRSIIVSTCYDLLLYISCKRTYTYFASSRVVFLFGRLKRLATGQVVATIVC